MNIYENTFVYFLMFIIGFLARPFIIELIKQFFKIRKEKKETSKNDKKN